MTKKISLVTKADAIYGSVLGICSIRLRPLPHSFYSTNYSLGATGEGLWGPCHFYGLEGQGQLLQFSQTKRKGKMRQPLCKGEVLHLSKIERARCPCATEPPPKQNKLVWTGTVHGVRMNKSQQRAEGCNLVSPCCLPAGNRNSFSGSNAGFAARPS